MAITGTLWIDTVTNRSSHAVDNARDYIDKSLRKPGNLKDLAVCVNPSTLNRIENDLLFLAKALDKTVTAKEWTMQSIPKVSDKTRLLTSLRYVIAMAAEYFGESEAPTAPTDLLTFEDFNSFERAMQMVYNVLFEPLYTENGELFTLTDGSYLVVRRSLDG